MTKREMAERKIQDCIDRFVKAQDILDSIPDTVLDICETTSVGVFGEIDLILKSPQDIVEINKRMREAGYSQKEWAPKLLTIWPIHEGEKLKLYWVNKAETETKLRNVDVYCTVDELPPELKTKFKHCGVKEITRTEYAFVCENDNGVSVSS